MHYQKVLFIYPTFAGNKYDRSVLPAVGIAYVAETLGHNGIDCKVLDIGLGYKMGDVAHCIKEYEPDIIGISLMTFRYKNSYQIIDFIKETFPSLPIVAGGAHITAFKEKVLRECTSIDFGISFEGEFPMLELCNGKLYEEIKGLIYRKNGRIIFNGNRAYIKDLDGIPFPTYSKFELNKYLDIIPIMTSRGCPYKCIFCSAGVISGRKLRTRTPESVMKELLFWYEKGFRKFSFLDDNFTLIKKRVYSLCDLMEKAGLKDLEIDCAGIRADMVDYPLLKKMRKVGFNTLAIGAESGVARMLKEIKKGEELKDIDRAIKDACKLGYKVSLYFVVGNPHETLEDVKTSIKFAEKYKIHNVFFSNLIPVPDTELYDIINREGRFIRPPSDYLNDINDFMDEVVFEVPGMSLEERKIALGLAQKCRERIQYRTHQRVVSHQQFDKYGLPGRFFAELYSSDPILKLRNLMRPVLYQNSN